MEVFSSDSCPEVVGTAIAADAPDTLALTKDEELLSASAALPKDGHSEEVAPELTMEAEPVSADPPRCQGSEMKDSTATADFRLLASSGLPQYLADAEVLECRMVSKAWATISVEAPTQEELWQLDLGKVRRAAAWKAILLGGINLQTKNPEDMYESLCQTPCPYDSAIQRDVSRTLPEEKLFKAKGGRGQSALFRLLRAIAIRLWDIGYCQSLNFVAATLIGIFPGDEAAAFHCALALLLRYSLVDLYRPRFPKLGVTVWVFDRLVEGFLPKVHTALQKHGVNAEYYALQWFLTLFASDLRQPVVRRVWDRFLVAGWRVVVQVGLALLYLIQDELPELDTCHALSYLKRFTRMCKVEGEELMNLAASFQVSHRMLSALEAAYSWEGEVQFFVVKDLNSGEVHWDVHSVDPSSLPPPPPPAEPAEDEVVIPMPRVFVRSVRGCSANGTAADADGQNERMEGLDGAPHVDSESEKGNVLPFLLHNLDTGETTVMEKAWSQYVGETRARSRLDQKPFFRSPQDSSTSAEARSSAGLAPPGPTRSASGLQRGR